MKHDCTHYTAEQISCFVDGEVPQDQADAMAEHLDRCPECRALAHQYQAMGKAFSRHAEKTAADLTQDAAATEPEAADMPARAPRPELGHRLAMVQNRNQIIFGWLYQRLSGRPLLMKTAGLAALLLVTLAIFTGGPGVPAGPSAIVSSVDTDYSSVMIIETPEHNHTIIWFSET